MNRLISFYGIDIRKIENNLHISAMCRQDNTFTRIIPNQCVCSVDFKVGNIDENNDALVVRVNTGEQVKFIHFRITNKCSPTEEEVRQFVNKVNMLIR